MTRGGARRRGLALSTLLAALLAASGCAVVETELSVAEDGSGTRKMGVVVSEEDLATAKLAPEKLEESVKRHLPEELAFDGMKKVDRNGTQGHLMEFSLDYKDLEDYEHKVEALLDDSGVDVDADVVQTRSDSPLVEGVQVRENFSSQQLLGWLEAGLHDDELIETSVQVNTGDDPDTVTFGGNAYESTGSQLNVQDVKDHGFRQVALVLTPAEGEDRYAASLRLDHQKSPDRITRDRVEAFFKDRLPEGAHLEPFGQEDDSLGSTPYGGYRVTLGEGSLEELAGRVAEATGGEAELAQESRPGQGGPLTTERALTYRLETTELLTPQAGDGAVSVALEDGDAVRKSSTGTKGELLTADIVELTELSPEVTVHAVDDVEATVDYVLPAGDGAAVRGAVEEALRPAEGAGDLTVEEDGDVLRFRVAVRGTPEEVTERLNALSSGYGAAVSVTQVRDGLRPEHRVDARLSGLAGALGAFPERTTPLRVSLPASASVQEDQGVEGQVDGGAVVGDGRVAFTMRSVSTGFWVMISTVVLAVLALAALAFLFRRRLSTAANGAWGRRGDVAQRIRSGAGAGAAAVGAGLATARARGEAGSRGVDGVGSEDGPFHESQMR